MSMIEKLEATLAGGMDNAQLRFGLASAYFRERRFADAREHARVAVEHDRDYSAAWRLLGRALVELDERQAAMEAFQSGIAAARLHGDMQLVKEMQVFVSRIERQKDRN